MSRPPALPAASFHALRRRRSSLTYAAALSPYLMPTRILVSTVALWEVGIALVLLLVFIVLAIWLASRIYSAGVLLYGQRAGIRTVLRATRVAR